MPIHIYSCSECGGIDDYLVQPDQRPSGCSNCSSDALTRVYAGQTFAAHTTSKSSGIRLAGFTGTPIAEVHLPCPSGDSSCSGIHGVVGRVESVFIDAGRDN